MSSKSGTLLLLLPLLLMPLAHATSQQQWDLSIDRITVLPLNGEVQQGQPLTLTIYIRNKESRVFSGIVKVSVFVDGDLKVVEFWEIGNVSKGSIPIPAGGYTTVTTKVPTSNLTVGVHDLKVTVESKEYGDPRPGDNAYTMKFSVIPLVEAFIDVEREMVQGREYFVKVHIPNPSSDALDLRVRLFVNDTEIGAQSVYVPPKSISMAEFPFTPPSAGSFKLTALITRGERPYSQASAKVHVKPSCDVHVKEVSIPRRVQRGEVLSGKIRVVNEGPSPSRVNVSVYVDDVLIDSQLLDTLSPKGEGSADVEIPTLELAVGNHTLTVSLIPLDAVDVDRADNDHSLSFQVMPLPVSLSASPSDGTIEINLTNVGSVLGTFDIILLREGEEIDNSSVTLDPGSSQLIVFKGVSPGNYTVTVLSYGVAVASAAVTVTSFPTPNEGISPYWGLVIGIVVALVAYFAFTKFRRRKWPAS